MLLLEDQQRASIRADKDEMCTLAKAQIDLELAKMRTMSSQEAAAAAARAVAEAEAAIAEAEEAAREAEAAEADAEAAQSFAEAAMKTLKGRNLPKMVKLYCIHTVEHAALMSIISQLDWDSFNQHCSHLSFTHDPSFLCDRLTSRLTNVSETLTLTRISFGKH